MGIDISETEFLDLGPNSDFFPEDRSYDLVEPEAVKQDHYTGEIHDAIVSIPVKRGMELMESVSIEVMASIWPTGACSNDMNTRERYTFIPDQYWPQFLLIYNTVILFGYRTALVRTHL